MFGFRCERVAVGVVVAVVAGSSLIGMGAAFAVPDEEREQQQAAAVFEMMCDKSPERDEYGYRKRDDGWYSDWMQVQDSHPYRIKGNGSPEAATRKTLYDESAFSPFTRSRICANPRQYAEELRNTVIEMKGEIKADCTVVTDPEREVFNCAVESGLRDFFAKKMAEFQRITEEADERSESDT